MSLAGSAYLAFLLLAVAAFRLAGASPRLRLGTLLALSLFFYASWNPLYCLPLALTATIDHSAARFVRGRRKDRAARLAVAAAVAANLSLLGFFKYFNFAADNAAWAAGLLGHPLPAPAFRVLFGVGISFYTFQSMSCLIDVYRGDAEPAGSLAEHLAFVSFFPTLAAGPITRAPALLPQLRRAPLPLSPEAGGKALFLIALGFVKKRAVADYLALNLVDRVFDLPGMYSSAEILAGVYGYAVQIWCDFSGYSDIAIGSALLLGFTLKDNFNAPYRAKDLPEFWRRWHISLSSWLRDYLFFSLPGRRSARWFPYLATFATFALGGLWHGASWTFLAWGALHGAGLAFSRLLEPARGAGRPATPPAWRRAAGVVLTFHFVCLAWIFFRADSIEAAFGILRGLGRGSLGTGNLAAPCLLMIGAGIGLQWLPERLLPRLQERFAALPSPAQCALLAAVAAVVVRVSGAAVSRFVYFNF